MPVRILGICGSPVKGGNTEAFLGEALKAAEGLGDVSTESVRLNEKRIADCRHCNWCTSKQVEGSFCCIKDDMLDIYPKIIEADALLIATPTYAGRLSGYSAVFMDRFRALVLGKRYRGVLRNKVGAGMTVAWMRNAGPETALLSVATAYLMWGMVLASPGEGRKRVWRCWCLQRWRKRPVRGGREAGSAEGQAGHGFGAGAGEANRGVGPDHEVRPGSTKEG
jgi:multimeric flavodoxin WrbA